MATRGAGATKANRERRAMIRSVEAARDRAAAKLEAARLEKAQLALKLKSLRGARPPRKP